MHSAAYLNRLCSPFKDTVKSSRDELSITSKKAGDGTPHGQPGAGTGSGDGLWPVSAAARAHNVHSDRQEAIMAVWATKSEITLPH